MTAQAIPSYSEVTWSGDQLLPQIGEPIYVRMNDFGYGTVTGYFVAYGNATQHYLGVVVTLEALPEWYVEQCQARGETPLLTGHQFFGSEIRRLEAV